MENKFLSIFKEEDGRQMAGLSRLIPLLEKEPQNKTLIDEAHRLFHNIKGDAGMVGLDEIAELARGMEKELEGAGAVTPDQLKQFAGAVQSLKALIDKL